MTDRRAAIVSLNFEGLARILFDKDTRILNARTSFNAYGYSIIDVVVEHPSFAVCETGVMLPYKVAVITQHEDGSRSIEFQDAS